MRQTLSATRSQEIASERLDVIRSLYNVSRALGWLGLFLPTALIAQGALSSSGLQPSISHTYHTAMGDVLVGTLFAIGIFLIAYKDFNPEEYDSGNHSAFWNGYWDRWFARAAGFGAIGVALFPVDPVTISGCEKIVQDAPDLACSTGGMTWQGYVSITTQGGEINNLLHFIPAGLFFFCICVICIRFFPEEPLKARYLGRNEDGDFEIELRRPSKRTVFFTSLGCLIAVCVAGLIYMAAKDGSDAPVYLFLERINGFFWLEVIAVVAFAVAWLAKSKDFKATIASNTGGGT